MRTHFQDGWLPLSPSLRAAVLPWLYAAMLTVGLASLSVLLSASEPLAAL